MLLGIDAGGSSTKWALFGPAGEVTRQGRLGPLTGHLFTPGDEAAMRALLRRLAEEIGPGPAAVVAGVSGLQAGAIPLLTAAISAQFGLPPERIRLTDDLELAYAAHFAPGEGVLVYAGTGSMAYHLAADGEVIRAGGHGFLLGDEGGAFWQGREALRTLLAVQDQRRSPAGPLAAELERVIGGLDWPQVRAWVYGGGRAALATLAPAVERAAHAGDAAALDVTRRAGEALGALARTVLGRCSLPLGVSLAGGAANELVRAAFLNALLDFLPGAVLCPARAPVLGTPRLSPLHVAASPADRSSATDEQAPAEAFTS